MFYLGMAQSEGLGEVHLWTGEGKGVISRRRCQSRALGQFVESQFTKINFMNDQFPDS